MCWKIFNIHLFLCHGLHLLEHCSFFFLACVWFYVGLMYCRCSNHHESNKHIDVGEERKGRKEQWISFRSHVFIMCNSCCCLVCKNVGDGNWFSMCLMASVVLYFFLSFTKTIDFNSPIPLFCNISKSFLMLSSRAMRVCFCVSRRISSSYKKNKRKRRRKNMIMNDVDLVRRMEGTVFRLQILVKAEKFKKTGSGILLINECFLSS